MVGLTKESRNLEVERGKVMKDSARNYNFCLIWNKRENTCSPRESKERFYLKLEETNIKVFMLESL